MFNINHINMLSINHIFSNIHTITTYSLTNNTHNNTLLQ